MAKLDLRPEQPSEKLDLRPIDEPKRPPISSIIEQAIRQQLGSQEPLVTAGMQYGPQALYGAAEPIRNIENILGARLPDYPQPTTTGQRIARGLGTGATALAMVPTGGEEAALPFIGKSALQGLIAGGLGGAHPDITNALAGSVLGGTLAGIPEVAGGALRGLGRLAERGGIFERLRTPAQVAEISSKIPGKRVPLQNILLSPGEDPVVSAARNKAENVIQDALGNTESKNIYSRLKSLIADKKNATVNKYNQLFKSISDRAKNITTEKEPVVLNNYASKLKSLQDEQPKIADFLDPKIKQLITDLQKAPDKKVSFDEAHKIQSIMGKQSAKTPELAHEYHGLQKGALKDIEEAYENLDPELHKKYMSVRQGYKTDYVPYAQKSLNNILKDKTAEDRLGGQLLQSKNRKILEDLGPEGKKLLTAHKLINHITASEAGHALDPVRFLASYDKIRPDLKDAISTPGIENNIADMRTILMAHRPKGTMPSLIPLGNLVTSGTQAIGKNILGFPAIREAYAAGAAPTIQRSVAPQLTRNALMAMLLDRDEEK